MTRSVEIPEEAVEAAATACHESDFAWSSEGIHDEYWRKMGRAALEAALPYLAPAGDGGLREALEQKLATTDGWAVANETLLDMLRAHPAEPTPTREQIVQALRDALTPWRSERSSLDSLAQPLADAVLAVLAGEQEQVESPEL